MLVILLDIFEGVSKVIFVPFAPKSPEGDFFKIRCKKRGLRHSHLIFRVHSATPGTMHENYSDTL